MKRENKNSKQSTFAKLVYFADQLNPLQFVLPDTDEDIGRFFRALFLTVFRNEKQAGVDFLQALTKAMEAHLESPFTDVLQIKALFSKWKGNRQLFSQFQSIVKKSQVKRWPADVAFELLIKMNSRTDSKYNVYGVLGIQLMQDYKKQGLKPTGNSIKLAFSCLYGGIRLCRPSSPEAQLRGQEWMTPVAFKEAYHLVPSWIMFYEKQGGTYLFSNDQLAKLYKKDFAWSKGVGIQAQTLQSFLATIPYEMVLTLSPKQLLGLALIFQIKPDLIKNALTLWSPEMPFKPWGYQMFDDFKIPNVILDYLLLTEIALTGPQLQFCAVVLSGKSLRQVTSEWPGLTFSKGMVKAIYEFNQYEKNDSFDGAMLMIMLIGKGIPQDQAIAYRHTLYDGDRIQTMVEWIFLLTRKGMGTDDIRHTLDFLRSQSKEELSQINLPTLTQREIREMTDVWLYTRLFESRTRRGQSYSFKAWSHIKECTWVINETKTIKISQILNSKDLFIEGKKQQHCVYSYSDFIRRGESAIFSLREIIGLDSPAQAKPLVTIEVRKNKITQALGFKNRQPTQDEKQWLSEWALMNQLTQSA